MRQSRSQSISACVVRVSVVAMITSACGGSREPAREPGAEARSPAERRSAERAPTKEPEMTMDQVNARCERLQQSAQIPVTCQTERIDDAPSMLVGFRSMEEASAYLEPFARTIGEPFCLAASQGDRPGFVYMAIGSGDERRGRRYSCELGQWGEWFPLGEHTGAMRPTLRDVIATCRGVQESEELPITCAVEELGGLPTVVIGFGTRGDVEQHLPVMLALVGEPFCDVANGAGRRAVFIVTVANAEARPFDCTGQSWGEWFSLTAATELPPGTLH